MFNATLQDIRKHENNTLGKAEHIYEKRANRTVENKAINLGSEKNLYDYNSRTLQEKTFFKTSYQYI